MLLLLSADFFQKKKFKHQEYYQSVKPFESRSGLRSVSPDLGPGYLSKDGKSCPKPGLSIHKVKNL